MSVNSISSYNPLTSIYGIAQTDSSQIASNISGTTSSQSTPDQKKISPMAQMMSQLAQMQTSAPAQFQQVTQAISTDLAAQAQSTTDPTQSSMLTDMAAKFAQAAQTGSMSSLMPSGSGSGGRVSRGGGGGGGFSAAASTISSDLSAILSNAAVNSNASIASNAGIFGMDGGPDAMRRDMRELRELEKSNPAEFKAVTEKISQDLAAQAKSATDPAQSTMLSNMSAKFASASASGDMSSFKPANLPSAPSAFGLSSNTTGTSSTAATTASSLLTSEQQMMQSFFEQIQNMTANNLSSFTSLGATSTSSSATS